MKILILSSGGDAPGMNRFIWSIYKKFKNQVYFAYAGFTGLVNGQIFPMESVIDKSQKDEAGTIIKTSRCPEFKEKKYFDIALENAKKFDAVVIMGGNGSEKGASQLYENGVNTIFVPATIDNDVENSSYSIGFSTAVKECVYTIENTMQSIKAFNNACLFEVMGRHDASICKAVAKQVNADFSVNEKKDLDYEVLKNTILKKFIKSESATIVVRENIQPIDEIAKKLNEELGMDIVKTQVVGRTQRGGKPTKFELEMAEKFARETVLCLRTKVFGVRILVDEKGEIIVKEF